MLRQLGVVPAWRGPLAIQSDPEAAKVTTVSPPFGRAVAAERPLQEPGLRLSLSEESDRPAYQGFGVGAVSGVRMRKSLAGAGLDTGRRLMSHRSPGE